MVQPARDPDATQVRQRPRLLTGQVDAAVVLASTLLGQAITTASTQRDVAARLGRSRTLVAQWCLPTSPKLPTAADRARLLTLCPAVARELLRLEAGVVSEAPRVHLAPAHHLAIVTSELGDVGRAVADGLAGDGQLDQAELDRVVRESRELLAGVARLLRDLETPI